MQINPDFYYGGDKNVKDALFQSYQFMQINPDSYLWEASRGAVLRG